MSESDCCENNCEAAMEKTYLDGACEDSLVDMLVEAMHWCAGNGISFDEAIRAATNIFHAEEDHSGAMCEAEKAAWTNSHALMVDALKALKRLIPVACWDEDADDSDRAEFDEALAEAERVVKEAEAQAQTERAHARTNEDHR